MKDTLLQFSDAFFYLLVIVIVFIIVKFIFVLIRYFIFKKLINLILDQIYEEEDEDDQAFSAFQSDKEDEVKKDLEREKKQEKEKEVEILKNKEKTISEEKIIGIAKKIYGPWSAKIVKEFMKKVVNLNPQDLQNKGYFQAMILAEKRRRELQQQGRNF